MSVQPPRSPNARTVPGYLIVLAAFSIFMFLVAMGFGLVAFGVIDLGGDEDARPTQIAGSDGALQRSGFTIRDTRIDGDTISIDVNIAVTNVSDEEIENATVLVQCLDGGNASATQLIVSIGARETQRFDLTLGGTGEPECSPPTFSFDVP